MNKKMTKKQIKERDETAALYTRLWDLAVGANGGCWPEDEENDLGVWAVNGCKDMARFIAAAEFAFDIGRHTPEDDNSTGWWDRKHATDTRNLEEWESLNRLTAFLHGAGVRA